MAGNISSGFHLQLITSCLSETNLCWWWWLIQNTSSVSGWTYTFTFFIFFFVWQLPQNYSAREGLKSQFSLDLSPYVWVAIVKLVLIVCRTASFSCHSEQIQLCLVPFWLPPCTSVMQLIIPGLKSAQFLWGSLSLLYHSLFCLFLSLSCSLLSNKQEATSLPISCQGSEQRSRNYPLQNWSKQS